MVRPSGERIGLCMVRFHSLILVMVGWRRLFGTTRCEAVRSESGRDEYDRAENVSRHAAASRSVTTTELLGWSRNRRRARRCGLSGNAGRHMFGAAAVACQALQVRAQLGCRLIAQITILLQTLVDDALQLRRSFGIQPHGSNRRRVENRSEDNSGSFAAERQRAGRHFIQDRAEREQVGACVQFLAAHLFGRHVGDGAERRARAGEVRLIDDSGNGVGGGCGAADRGRAELRYLGETEIQDLGMTAIRNKDVGGLDITMNDALTMRCV